MVPSYEVFYIVMNYHETMLRCVLSDDSCHSDRPHNDDTDDDDDDDDNDDDSTVRRPARLSAERGEGAELAVTTYLSSLPGQTTDVIGQWEQHTRVSHIHTHYIAVMSVGSRALA